MSYYYYSYVLIEAECQCYDCDWKCSSKNAQAVAKIHAKKYGHKVGGSLEHLFSYNFHKDEKESEKEES